MVRRIVPLLAALAILLVPAFAGAQYTDRTRDPGTPVAEGPKLEHVGVKEHLGGILPKDASFRDETGASVTLGTYFSGKKPAVLVFAYHSCPMLCSMVLDATVKGLKGIDWTVGKEYDVVVLSIDPKEELDRTNRKRNEILSKYGRGDGPASGMHFLIGDKVSIDRAADAAGLEYQYDAASSQYGHPATIMLVAPNGEFARYLYGLDYSPNDLKIGLIEASKGNHISTIDQVILYCFMYDGKQSRYVLVAKNVMKLGGVITALLLGGTLALFWLRERRRKTGGLLSPTPLSPAEDSGPSA
jgi:protein SCO1/2